MIKLKTAQEIEKMRKAGKILKQIFGKLKNYVVAGRTTKQLDDYVAGLIAKEDATAAFYGYRGFPANICVSVNEEVVHGIPSDRRIKDGDIVSLDFGVCYQNYYADSCITIPVGKVSATLKKLIKVTRESLCQGIKQARPGKRIGDISHAVQSYIESNGFSVVRQFIGHGIGSKIQEEPEIPNFGQPHKGIVLKAGMVIAIEPMVNMGTWEVEILDDDWTVVTKDRLPSAHFEHTVAITEKGPEVLT